MLAVVLIKIFCSLKITIAFDSPGEFIRWHNKNIAEQLPRVFAHIKNEGIEKIHPTERTLSVRYYVREKKVLRSEPDDQHTHFAINERFFELSSQRTPAQLTCRMSTEKDRMKG